MQGVQEQLEQALRDRAGVVALRTHPELAWALRSAKRRGEVVAVWPGIYAAQGDATDFRIKVLALFKADPDAILVGPSAEVAFGWRAADAHEVVTASSRRLQTQQRGFRLVRRRIAADDIATWTDEEAPPADRLTVRLTVLPSPRSTSPANEAATRSTMLCDKA